MSKCKGANLNSLNSSEMMNNMCNNSDEPCNSVNQILMPTLQLCSSVMSTHCYTSHISSIPLPKFSGDSQELIYFHFE